MTSKEVNQMYLEGRIGFDGWLNHQADFAPHSGRDTGMFAKKSKKKRIKRLTKRR